MAAYRVTRRIEFCYGHRLLGHGGPCRHLHGHNAVAEVEVEAAALSAAGMVVDFADIRDRVKGWVDAHLDHCMLLQADDPVVPLLQNAGERVHVMDHPPTAEHIARLIFDQARAAGLAVTEVRLWETPSSVAAVRGTDSPNPHSASSPPEDGQTDA